jgi:mRNA-degrading endonuclease RelE of RelBE toxin-antitoxin system
MPSGLSGPGDRTAARDRGDRAARAIQEKLPEAVAFAVIDFIAGPLLDNPRRMGAALHNELEAVWSARRGTYRILYRIDDERREVIVLRVGHRRGIYRSR